LLQLRLGSESLHQLGESINATDANSRGPSKNPHSQSRRDLQAAWRNGPTTRLGAGLLDTPDLASCCLSLSSLSEVPSDRHAAKGPATRLKRSLSAPCSAACHDVQTSAVSTGGLHSSASDLHHRYHEQKEIEALDGFQLQALRFKYLGGANASLEDLHCAVQALRQRYLQHYFQAKPMRHSTTCNRSRAVSDTQLLRCRRRISGRSAPRLRSGCARPGSRRRSRPQAYGCTEQ